jgi:hypothetical protein
MNDFLGGTSSSPRIYRHEPESAASGTALRKIFGAWAQKRTSSSYEHLRVEPRPAPPRRGPPARFSPEKKKLHRGPENITLEISWGTDSRRHRSDWKRRVSRPDFEVFRPRNQRPYRFERTRKVLHPGPAIQYISERYITTVDSVLARRCGGVGPAAGGAGSAARGAPVCLGEGPLRPRPSRLRAGRGGP